jgi:hypothetical protein
MTANPGHPAVCIIADDDGSSRLVDIMLPLSRKIMQEDGTAMWDGLFGSGVFGIAGASSGGNHHDWHTSGMPGLSITLSGAWEIEAGSGQRRLLEPGAILVMFDTHGRGHRSHTMRQPCATMGLSFDAATEAAIRALVTAAQLAEANTPALESPDHV